MLDPTIIALLILAALAAGWVDAVTGGGGMLQLPALMIALPQQAPVQALGTNKLSSIFGTSAAAATYVRNVKLDLRTAVPMAVTAFVGAAIGAALASRVPAEAFRPIIIGLLIFMWIWILINPSVGRSDAVPGNRRSIGIVAAFVIGGYDGIFGPGTGSFLLIVLVSILGYSFLQASATAKIVNLGTNAAALIVFGLTGSVLWLLGFAMAAANVMGAVLGARMAVRRGSGFVRIVFLVVVALLIIRLAWEGL
jgi:uncharacterized membrane protein YfcA